MPSKKYTAIIRELAGQLAEIAALPVQEEKRRLWRKLNGLKPERPMVMIDQVCWNEMNIDDELTIQSENPECHPYERQMRMTLFRWKHFPVDMVVEPYMKIPRAVKDTGFGMRAQDEVAVTDAANAVKGHLYSNQLATDEDLERIKMPMITPDKAETERRMAFATDLFGDTIELRPWSFVPYVGIWDKAAGARHPEWGVVTADGTPAAAPFGQNNGAPTAEIMCPRGPYLEELMIPQMRELIDRYEVDGFWVDGDMWAVAPCYCERCKAAWHEETGLSEPPVEVDDPLWPHWWDFTRASFNAFVTRYCDAVHQHKPGVLVCSNWMQTYKNPGAPTAPTDWISGDADAGATVDESRLEARFLSTRGKPWDIMLWNSRRAHATPDSPATVNSPEILMQSAAVLLAFGGNVQIYEHPPLRDGRLIGWRQDRLGEVGRFVKARRTLCQNTSTVPQIAVLHSEHHLYSTIRGKNLLTSADTRPVGGAVYALLENSYGVDILDEWALLPRLREFPLVVVPEQDALSATMLEALKQYVEGGGRLLVSGSRLAERFGEAFLGFATEKIATDKAYAIAAGDGSEPLYSSEWRLGRATTAEPYAAIGEGCLVDDRCLPYPAAVFNRVGSGMVGYVPANLFRFLRRNRYPLMRRFLGELVEKLLPAPDIRVEAPAYVDVVLRQREDTVLVHVINLANGGSTGEIPPSGPLTVRMRLTEKPRAVTLELEPGELDWQWDDGCLTVGLQQLSIHAVIVVVRNH